MKRLLRCTTILCIFLALCLLPLVAGAEEGEYAHLSPKKFEFTVGEAIGNGYGVSLRIYPDNPGPAGEDGFKDKTVSDVEKAFIDALQGSGIEVNATTIFGRIVVNITGTPIKGGEYRIGFTVSQKNSPDRDLLLTIIVSDPNKPSAPVVDNVIYNAAPEHEQALIRGVREWCNVRAGAGTQNEIIGRANLGQQISLLRWNADESWCFVEFNGMQGWIAKQFILPIK